MKILLLTPPMTQLNTPYPATAYLMGFLRKHAPHVEAVQADPAIQLIHRLFSKRGVQEIHAEIFRGRKKPSQSVQHFLENFELYAQTIDAVVRFLEGRDPSLSLRIVGRDFLPEGPRFPENDEAEDENLEWSFGVLGVQDRAKYLASLYIDDLADVIKEGVDARFELSRYGEKLAASAATFDALDEALHGKPTLVDRYLDEITLGLLKEHRPDMLGLTVPFPGNVYAAFRIAAITRQFAPETKILMGGGYVNTELRELKDPRVFDYVDYIPLDDGERPLLCILRRLEGKKQNLLRTFTRDPKSGEVVYENDPLIHDIPHKDIGTPTYQGLDLSRYLSLFEMLNPMHRIWSDGRWNKITLAHGCYWKKCSFCDVTLDYIGRYDPAPADLIVDRIEALIEETGQTGFHFVDEAAPPALLRALAERLLSRGVAITWWGNVRFEKTFTPELVDLLARSGCIAISGGLEVASDRLLRLMQKGVTVEQVARVTRAFTDVGIMVHAYLMYGFPTQTEQETVDALERVRQLFETGCIQSAYWHRFSVTAHSPIGKNPERFGIRLLPEPEIRFARNDLAFEDPTGCDHDEMGEALKKALYNFMHGTGFDTDVRFWFDRKVVRPKVDADLIARALEEAPARGVSDQGEGLRT